MIERSLQVAPASTAKAAQLRHLFRSAAPPRPESHLVHCCRELSALRGQEEEEEEEEEENVKSGTKLHTII